MNNERMKWMTIVWMLICTTLLAFVAALILQNLRLQDELAKPLKLTYQQKHKVVGEWLQNMDGETKYALRKIIGCTDKER